MRRRISSFLLAVAFVVGCAAPPEPEDLSRYLEPPPPTITVEVIVLGPDGDRVPRGQIAYAHWHAHGGGISGGRPDADRRGGG